MTTEAPPELAKRGVTHLVSNKSEHAVVLPRGALMRCFGDELRERLERHDAARADRASIER